MRIYKHIIFSYVGHSAAWLPSMKSDSLLAKDEDNVLKLKTLLTWLLSADR